MGRRERRRTGQYLYDAHIHIVFWTRLSLYLRISPDFDPFVGTPFPHPVGTSCKYGHEGYE